MGERRDGTLALGAGGLLAETDGTYVLNTGGAYGGEMHLSGTIRLRLADGELVMLREHDRARIIGAWTGARVDGRRVVASGIRWAETGDAAETKALFDGRFLRAASIGFSATWTWVGDVPPAEKERLQRDEGADLARLVYVLTDVEVYEASLVAVGADAGARWGYAPGEQHGTLGDGRRVPAHVAAMARHLVDHHGMTAEQAASWLLGQQVQAIVDAVEAPPVAEVSPDPEPEDDGDGGGEDGGEMSAAPAPRVSGIHHLLRPVPPEPAARTGITHLLRAPQR